MKINIERIDDYRIQVDLSGEIDTRQRGISGLARMFELSPSTEYVIAFWEGAKPGFFFYPVEYPVIRGFPVALFRTDRHGRIEPRSLRVARKHSEP